MVLVGFTSMLVGTSKSAVDDAGETEAESDEVSATTDASEPAPKAGEVAKPAASLPSTDDWEQVVLEDVGIRFKIPPDARAPAENSGHDLKYSGRYFNVFFGELMVNFAQGTVTSEGVHSGVSAIVEPAKKRLQEDPKAFRGVVFDAPDAFVADREEGPPIGEYCEAIACSKEIEGRPLCATATAEMDASKVVDEKTYLEAPVHKLTAEQCLAVVAIARSVEAIE